MRRVVTWAVPALLALGVWACHSEKNEVAIMTYNIRHGVGMDGFLNLNRTVAAIQSFNPDILILNEVDEGTQRSFFVRQADSLGELLGMRARFGRSIDYDGGQYGNALLSVYPILDFQVIDLSVDAPLEGRSVFLAELLVFEDTLYVMGAHLGLQEEEQSQQVETILRSLPGSENIILAGDFNFTPETASYQAIQSKLLDGIQAVDRAYFSFPSDQPDRRIDYVFIGKGLHPLRADVLNDPLLRAASDHLPQQLIVQIK